MLRFSTCGVSRRSVAIASSSATSSIFATSLASTSSKLLESFARLSSSSSSSSASSEDAQKSSDSENSNENSSSSSSSSNNNSDSKNNKDTEKRLTPFETTAPILHSESISINRTTVELALKEEERRLSRVQQSFEDMIVFQGGAIADHENFGNRMMMRDFVHYALYHYKWGYYSKLVRKYRGLMTSQLFDPVPFAALRNKWDYENYVTKITDATPTYVSPPSLFQPFYGWVLAEYMITVMRAKFDPTEPLVIYEVGAFNGMLALNTLDFLAEQYPDVYQNVEYHCIDVCGEMINVMRSKLVQHMHKVKLHHISIFNWREVDPRRCFVIGIEVMSSMPHDLVVHSEDGTVYQSFLKFPSKDNLATAEERWERCSDPLILRYLRYTELMREETFNALKVLCITDGKVNSDPAKWNTIEPTAYDSHGTIVLKSLNIHNPYKIVWIPTGQMVMFETLAQFFPRHHAFFADWTTVQNPIMGVNAPVVQAKLRIGKEWFVRRVAGEFLQNAGMVDLCFPTDFDLLTNNYKSICGSHKEIMNVTHPDFWKTFGGEKTSLFAAQSGYNPLLEDFDSFSIFASHHPAEL